MERPGRHTLRIEGLGETRDEDAKHRILLMRPHLIHAVGLTIFIILSGAALSASLLLLLIRLTEKATGV